MEEPRRASFVVAVFSSGNGAVEERFGFMWPRQKTESGRILIGSDGRPSVNSEFTDRSLSPDIIQVGLKY